MADLSIRRRGRELNQAWNIGARHALYRENGAWYHQLTAFPGALIDAHGYILFATEQEYLQCSFLQIGKEINVPGGITQIPGYVRVRPVGNIQRSQKESIEAQASVQVPSELPAVNVHTLTVREGRLQLVEHFRRERNREIIKAKKQQVLHMTGRLTCEVCSFDFERIYGRLGRGFCEVHHKIPLAEVDIEVTTALEDLAILCANCHRMVHRTNPFKSLEELKQLVTSGT
jgi:5-methylcytosine-specific restriction endonuclease McrA